MVTTVNGLVASVAKLREVGDKSLTSHGEVMAKTGDLSCRCNVKEFLTFIAVYNLDNSAFSLASYSSRAFRQKSRS